MRNLFFALVLGNLGFAAWSAWVAPAQRVGRPANDGLPALTLVSEVPADLRSSGVVVETAPPAEEPGGLPAALDPTASPVSPAEGPEATAIEPSESLVAAADDASPAAGSGRCTSVGPFRELSQAAAAAAALRAAGYEPVQRVAEGELWIGYWVYISGLPTEQAANEILAKVREQGITDSYVIPNSDSGNLVSLGVFSEISGVGRRRDQVRALGLEPQVVDRTRRATVYWVDVTLAPEQTLDFDSLQPAGRIIRLEQRDCERPAG
jgi:cell division septation protein DedD